MRLLRVEVLNLELVEFQADPPPYAILSHRWENGEIIHSDVFANTTIQKAGLAKIRGALEQAKQDGLQYLWVDTCCIDKTNNSELSEAINSMYRWYKQANTCYAYLSDVEDLDDLATSKWFTRGWTLQELLAPEDLVFFSRDWSLLGTKAELVDILSTITGIDPTILRGSSPITSASIAQRMSWASKRVTTRIEDIAYCLLGIFDVNMPLIYGEGDKAFTRLQEQIANESDDYTLFAWTNPDAWVFSGQVQGLLAKHPSHFIDSGHYLPCYDPQSSEPYSINKKRLKIEVRLVKPQDVPWMLNSNYWPYVSFLAILSCMDERRNKEVLIAIAIKQIALGRGEFRRSLCSELFQLPCSGALTSIWAPQTLSDVPADRVIRPPDYAITLCNIYKDFFTRVELIDYNYEMEVRDRNVGLITDPEHDAQEKSKITDPKYPVQERSKLLQRLALRGRPRRFFGESSPDKIAVTLLLRVGHPREIPISHSHELMILCGMTAELKLGFQVFWTYEWFDHLLEVRPLVAWDGKTPVKLQMWQGCTCSRVYSIEFIPRAAFEVERASVKLMNHLFDLRITSNSQGAYLL